MSITKNINLKDENTDTAIKLLLNISFPKDAVRKECVHDK